MTLVIQSQLFLTVPDLGLLIQPILKIFGILLGSGKVTERESPHFGILQKVKQDTTPHLQAPEIPLGKDAEVTDYSSQDATLLEVREQVLGEKTQGSSKPKASQKNRRAPQRGSPCVKSFSLR